MGMKTQVWIPHDPYKKPGVVTHAWNHNIGGLGGNGDRKLLELAVSLAEKWQPSGPVRDLTSKSGGGGEKERK